MVNIINDYIHEYDFPYHDSLKPYKEELVNYYNSLKKENKNLADCPLSHTHPLHALLSPKLNKLIKKNYWVNPPLIDYGFTLYIQNHIQSTSFYHNHLSPSSISGVFYLDPPQEGGEIIFSINPGSEEIIIKPKKNKLYLFPYWLNHTPLPQKDEKYRVCFNWIYGSSIRPVHKMTLSQW
jgi:hypothetical protein